MGEEPYDYGCYAEPEKDGKGYPPPAASMPTPVMGRSCLHRCQDHRYRHRSFLSNEFGSPGLSGYPVPAATIDGHTFIVGGKPHQLVDPASPSGHGKVTKRSTRATGAENSPKRWQDEV